MNEPRRNLSRKETLALIAFLVLFAAAAAVSGNVRRLWRFYTFFDPDKVVENFRSLDKTMDGHWIRRSGPAFEFKREPKDIGKTYIFKDESKSIKHFLDETVTTGLLVVKDDTIVSENYFLGNTEGTLNTSMSVAKSFVSALVGIAIEDGLIADVDRPISDYVPKLRGSGYDGVPIKHVLQMSSGVKFNEVYDDPHSDINTMFFKIFGLGQSIDDYIAGLKREYPSGTTSYYRSCDTQALGMLVSAVTGKRLSSYLEEKIWSRIGMEYDSYWCTDTHGIELAFAFLNAAVRDYAKFGRLYLHNGNWNGEQIVSEKWVRESVVPDNPNLQPGPKPEEYWTFGNFGYQYQWWIPEHSDGEFMAIGVWGQYIYISQKDNLVVVKTSVDPHFADNDFEHDDETVAVFRAIGAHLRAASAPGDTPAAVQQPE